MEESYYRFSFEGHTIYGWGTEGEAEAFMRLLAERPRAGSCGAHRLKTPEEIAGIPLGEKVIDLEISLAMR